MLFMFPIASTLNDAGNLGSFRKNLFELGHQLVGGDDDLDLGLVDGVHDGLLAQVGVEGHQGEGLLEAGLGRQHPLGPGQ